MKWPGDCRRSAADRLRGAKPSSLDNLKMLDLAGYGPLWTAATRYDAPSLTPLGRALRRVVEDVSAGLLVLDSLAAVYGANENDRGQVRDFMASWDAWATAADCTVLIIGHPPKSAAGYSGSTDWHSAARARWEISKEPLQSASRNSRQGAYPLAAGDGQIQLWSRTPRAMPGLGPLRSPLGSIQHLGGRGWRSPRCRPSGDQRQSQSKL